MSTTAPPSTSELVLYELSGKNDLRFSPYCWRTRMALAHKGLAATCMPVRFTEMDRVAFSGQRRVPVLVDHGVVVAESGKIAQHLERTYPDRPSLFGGASGEALARFLDAWTGRVMFPRLVDLVLCDVLDHLEADDAEYIRESRERRLGSTLESLCERREANLPIFRASLDPMRSVLRRTPFISGEAPTYADYIVFGPFQWARMISSFRPLAGDDPVLAWRDRMLELFDRLAGSAPGYY